MVNEGHHRGAIVDTLLDGHDTLLQTPEGRVFQSFHQQLQDEVELDAMKRRLRMLLAHPQATEALSVVQQSDLRWLVLRLIKESATVIRTRSRSERDVRSFLRTGLAAEHHRIGQLLSDVFKCAQSIDWAATSIRRQPSSLPPIAIACGGLPLIERLRVKSLDQEALRELDLQSRAGNIDQIDEDFWSSLDGLDRDAWVRETAEALRASSDPLTLRALADRLTPTHDLESLAVWIGMAREADAPVGDGTETIDLTTPDGLALQFVVPHLTLSPAAFEQFEWEP